MSNWIIFASFVNYIDMITVKDLLERNNINCVVQNPFQSENYTIISSNSYDITLKINTDDYSSAHELLIDYKLDHFMSPIEQPFITWLKKTTDKIFFLKNTSIGVRLGFALLLVALIATSAIFLFFMVQYYRITAF